ncbi:MAG TPA: UDP-N-acetylmuramate--L-alanine ligase [Patescibacteria group bacterium]|nr:UDP-N-acetylmuramate--L-alanine ligase [Patescibacteria group bacterium]
MDFFMPTHAHLIGIGGIGMSGLAKLLQKSGVRVSGSDVAASELTDALRKYSIDVKIGHDAENIPEETDLIIYSSAVPETNPERAEARKRGIPQLTNFQFLGRWTETKHPILVCGTHGKSTTTALTGLLLIQGGIDPTVIVGSQVPDFKDGNIYFGTSDLVVIEGDEYAKHFLEFEPSAVILNNIELDHTDVFPDLESLIRAFRELLLKVRHGGLVVANADDARVQTLIGEERGRLESRQIKIKTFGFGSHADLQIADCLPKPQGQTFALRDETGLLTRYSLHIPGRMNVMNAVAAMTLAQYLGVSPQAIRETFDRFKGIWRRFEIVLDRGQVTVVSDYGHHPTAVAATLDAAHSFFPGRRIVLCFQPHHHNRTKQLFADFIPSFDKADALLLTEIYDVAGRDAAEDQNVSSRDLQEAVLHRDEERGIKRLVEYASDPKEALNLLKRWRKPNDVVIVMGAGDIYKIAVHVLDA